MRRARPRPVGHERKQLRPRQVGPQLAFGHGVLQFVGQQRRGVAGLQIILALPQDHRGRGLSAGLRLGEHAGALDRIEGESAPAFCFSSKPCRQVANSSVQASMA